MARRWLERLLDRSMPLKVYEDVAADWTTCAVGEIRKDFPAVVIGRPLLFSANTSVSPADSKLYELGGKFYNHVSRGQRNAALKTYDAIQARVRLLIRKAQAAK